MSHSKIEDVWQRPLKDIRISVTDRCNFRCAYCMPAEIFGDDFAFLPREELLNFEEIERVVKLLVEMGVEKVRLTGGEPLLRKDLSHLIAKLSQLGVQEIALTTNGIHLSKLAHSLKEAGLKRVNVSLDALDDKLFGKLNGQGIGVKPILKGIDAALEAGLMVKVNMVVKKGTNESEIFPMAQYFKELGITLRFIEFMDVGSTNGWDYKHVMTKKEIYDLLSSRFTLERVSSHQYGEVAKRYRYAGTSSEIGFISSVSESFCSTCTRGRISADGKFYTCLFSSKGHDLRQVIRSGASDEEVARFIRDVWANRTDRYSDERTIETAKNREKIEMSYIGG